MTGRKDKRPIASISTPCEGFEGEDGVRFLFVVYLIIYFCSFFCTGAFFVHLMIRGINLFKCKLFEE